MAKAIEGLQGPTHLKAIRESSSLQQPPNALIQLADLEGMEWILPIREEGAVTPDAALIGWIWLGEQMEVKAWSHLDREAMKELVICAGQLQGKAIQESAVSPPTASQNSVSLVEPHSTFWPELAQSLAHEVRNPLSSIRTAAQLLPEHHDDLVFCKKLSNMVEQETSRLDQMVTEMENFADQINSNGQQTENNLVDLSVFLRQLVIDFRVRGITGMEIMIRDILPPLVSYPQCLQHTVRHLLMNAIEAGPGDHDILVRLGIDQKKNQEFLFAEIVDSGFGLPNEPVQRLFSPFFSTKAKGFGLGLPFARHCLESHDGSLKLKRLETGTRVRMDIPLRELLAN